MLRSRLDFDVATWAQRSLRKFGNLHSNLGPLAQGGNRTWLMHVGLHCPPCVLWSMQSDEVSDRG